MHLARLILNLVCMGMHTAIGMLVSVRMATRYMLVVVRMAFRRMLVVLHMGIHDMLMILSMSIRDMLVRMTAGRMLMIVHLMLVIPLRMRVNRCLAIFLILPVVRMITSGMPQSVHMTILRLHDGLNAHAVFINQQSAQIGAQYHQGAKQRGRSQKKPVCRAPDHPSACNAPNRKQDSNDQHSDTNLFKTLHKAMHILPMCDRISGHKTGNHRKHGSDGAKIKKPASGSAPLRFFGQRAN